jgi:hypothetical protein
VTTKHFDYIINKIASAKRNADSLASGINHHGIEGQIRELAAKECIEPFLTQSYSCGTGKVIDALQSISDQMDLIVYHRKVAPPILVNRDLGLFPVECVRYVVEVKSTLTATEIRDTNKKFRSIANLKSFPRIDAEGKKTYGKLPTTVLLAFSSDIVGSELERYRKHTDDEFPPCVVICVLGKGYWFYDGAKKEWYGQETSNVVPEYFEFSMFITGFMNTLAAEETSMKPFNPGAYVNIEDVILQPIEGSQEV